MASKVKVLWTAACVLRNRCAERADLKRCILCSRRRTPRALATATRSPAADISFRQPERL